MRKSVQATLKALYEGKKVIANNSQKYSNTRAANQICILRNTLKIEIATDRIIENDSWHGSYRLIRTEENLRKVRGLLTHQDEVQKS